MQVQFSPSIVPKVQPSPKNSTKPINKGLPFEIVRDNLINLAKFQLGNWPVINKDKQLIQIEEGVTPDNMSTAARSVRWMTRKLCGAFDPDFVDEVFRTALKVIRLNRGSNVESECHATELIALFKPALVGLQQLTVTYFTGEKHSTSKRLDRIWVDYTKLCEKELAIIAASKSKVSLASEGATAQQQATESQINHKEDRALLTLDNPNDPAAPSASDIYKHVAKVNDASIPQAALTAPSNSKVIVKLATEIREIKAALSVSVSSKAESIITTQPSLNPTENSEQKVLDEKKSNQPTYRKIERKPLPSEGKSKSPADLLAEAMKKRRAAMLIDIDLAPLPIEKKVVEPPPKKVVPKTPAKTYPTISPEKLKQYEEAKKKFHAEMLAKLKNSPLRPAEKVLETPKPVGKLTKIQCGFAQFFNLGMLGQNKATESKPLQDITNDWVDLTACGNDTNESNPDLYANGPSKEAPVQTKTAPDFKVPVRRATSELYDRKYMQGLMDTMQAELDQSA